MEVIYGSSHLLTNTRKWVGTGDFSYKHLTDFRFALTLYNLQTDKSN